jgi:putative ABC transport system permease protein
MFLRLLWESFVRQRRRKALAGLAILLGTTAVTAMLALATTIGDRIHAELAVYGANIIVYPKADQLEVKIGGVDVRPATGGAYLHEADLEKLKTIFWANNITGVSPELRTAGKMIPVDWAPGIKTTWVSATNPLPASVSKEAVAVDEVGYWFDHAFAAMRTGAPALHPWWKIRGRWPSETAGGSIANSSEEEVAVGSELAERLNLHIGDAILLGTEHVGKIVGIVTSGDQTDDDVLYALDALAPLIHRIEPDFGPGDQTPEITRIEIAARTKPEDAFARQDPDTLSPQKRETWYCSPYANSIAYQIREAIPGSDAQQIRKVEQSEGTVLERISGLMWLVSLAALVAAGFAVSAAMATAVLERRKEIGLMRSLGASQTAIASLFYAESALLATLTGTLGYLAGSALAFILGARIFPGDGTPPLFNPVLLPVVLAMALIVALAGSTPSILGALRTAPADTLRGNV